MKKTSIEKASIQIDTKSALSLQRIWVALYNEYIQVDRPEAKLQSRPTTVSTLFRQIFEVAKATREASHEFKISTIKISSSIFSAARADILNDLADGAKKDEDEEDEIQEELQHKNFTKVESVELEKLTSSSCINLLNNNYQCHASQSLPEKHFSDIKSKCSELKFQFNDGLSCHLSNNQ
ncbi:hypothetical protein BDF14DRAFT_1192574 [Spinellus fusiger]|nr:hypothetical protein BDF14DRAFT_1192574 [Spinellus fusiger]